MSKSSRTAAGGSPRKPSTRSSIRLSLGFASKALADVISKDSSKDTDKSARKAKENNSRRLSGITAKPAPRASMGDVKPPIHAIKRIDTPESKTLTRRRTRVSMDEQSSGTLETGVRTVTLRSRTIGSGLPKYRPKSTAIQSTKSPSPTTGSRRPLSSSSEDEKEDRLAEKMTISPSEKASRPISPLPQRAALKSNARTVNATPPPSTPSKVPKPSTTPVRTSPSRPAKLAKVVTPASAIASAIPRPTSTSSSDAEAPSLSLRPPRQQGDKQGRGSILSWEQLASEASKTLGDDEIEHMLSEFPAPFQADVVSPTPSQAQLDIPESPCLSAMNSPGGYGSISQVLLPDVTPSPAFHHQQLARFDLSHETSATDAATVTLLRLQLAAAENTAKERLVQMQSMEEEIHNLKKSRGRDTLHLSEQIAILEQQLKNSLEMRERADEERTLYTRGLEDQLRQEQTMRDKAVKTAVIRGQELARAEYDAAFKPQRDSLVLASSARIAALEWNSVREMAELELDVVREEMQVLSLLLAELSQSTLKF
ncbi:hypothetical protein C0992_007555 [Termitomyces sp. T32_za158]|nr:hypothetical protein C0992_007555 [Termitomyces sp. T32_za158]